MTRGNGPALAAVALGGALGAPARMGIAQLVHVSPAGFPWPTFWTNVTGSFALGIVVALMIERFPPSRFLRPFVATGFLGAYTTYSTFAVESVLLTRGGHLVPAFAYVASSLLAGLVAVRWGMWAGRKVPLRPVGAGR